MCFLLQCVLCYNYITNSEAEWQGVKKLYVAWVLACVAVEVSVLWFFWIIDCSDHVTDWFFSLSLIPLSSHSPTVTLDTGCFVSIVFVSRETTSKTSTSWAEICQRPSSSTIHRKPLHIRWIPNTKPSASCFLQLVINEHQFCRKKKRSEN